MWGFAGVIKMFSAPLKCISRNPFVGVLGVIIIYTLVSLTGSNEAYTVRFCTLGAFPEYGVLYSYECFT